MKRIYGEKFTILTPRNIIEQMGEMPKKNWQFNKKNKNLTDEIEAIVAKSDWVRLKFIHEHGGYWTDADTIALSNATNELSFKSDKLHWNSEAFFGSIAKSELLKNASNNMLASDLQIWGNPGNIKNLIEQQGFEKMPLKLFDPGFNPTYTFKTSEVMFSQLISAEDFLSNKDVKFIKLYNTIFSSTDSGSISVSSLIKSKSLLSKIFSFIEPSATYWIDAATELEEQLIRESKPE